MSSDLRCPKCANAIMSYDQSTQISGIVICQKCQTKWLTVLANNKVWYMKAMYGK